MLPCFWFDNEELLERFVLRKFSKYLLALLRALLALSLTLFASASAAAASASASSASTSVDAIVVVVFAVYIALPRRSAR
jgi:hypothetical protein